jgi:hypothetical protein
VRRLLLGIALAGAALAVGAGPAAATNECRGLMVCVPVAGPWVAVPAARSTPRPRVEFQLSCPRGFVVGGLDAELSDRAIDVSFQGKLGSPVNPGVTTERAVVISGTYTGGGVAPTFRPHIGCMPASGGAGGRVPFSAGAVFPPGSPTVRRVSTVNLRPNAGRRVVRGCAVGERLISGWHAVGFYSARPPSAALVSSVAARLSLGGNRVSVVVRAGALSGVRTVVQAGAVCGGGR